MFKSLSIIEVVFLVFSDCYTSKLVTVDAVFNTDQEYILLLC